MYTNLLYNIFLLIFKIIQCKINIFEKDVFLSIFPWPDFRGQRFVLRALARNKILRSAWVIGFDMMRYGWAIMR
jgi:hypothetical protein